MRLWRRYQCFIVGTGTWYRSSSYRCQVDTLLVGRDSGVFYDHAKAFANILKWIPLGTGLIRIRTSASIAGAHAQLPSIAHARQIQSLRVHIRRPKGLTEYLFPFALVSVIIIDGVIFLFVRSFVCLLLLFLWWQVLLMKSWSLPRLQLRHRVALLLVRRLFISRRLAWACIGADGGASRKPAATHNYALFDCESDELRSRPHISRLLVGGRREGGTENSFVRRFEKLNSCFEKTCKFVFVELKSWMRVLRKDRLCRG